MELRRFKFKRHESDPLVVIPLGDIQWTGDDEDIALHMLMDTVNWGVENGAYFVGMGDYIDFMSPSNREAFDRAGLYDNARAVAQRSAEGLVHELYERVLKPTTGRWLGLLEGHHYFGFSDGTTSDKLLADLLGTTCLGTQAFLSLKPANQSPVVVWAAHGLGSGATPGSQTNKIDKVAQWAEADLYLMGHWTKVSAVPVVRLVPNFDTGELEHRDRYLVGTGGYQKGYRVGAMEGLMPRGTYVEQKMLRPVTLGSPVVYVEEGKVRVQV